VASPIRPQLPLAPPTRPTGPADGARAAQRAFFAQALNSAQTPAQTPAQNPAPIAEAAAVAQVQRRAEAPRVERVAIPDQQPERPLRPGSLLDIKI
jgi:hypothetical protein